MAHDFKEGDYVWFEYCGEDVYATYIREATRKEMPFTPPCGLVQGEGRWFVQLDRLTFVTRPQGSDHGALEYDEIMALQEEPDANDL